MNDRDKALEAAARRLGLCDPDMLKIAKPNLSPDDAVDDLARRFPDAFKSTALRMSAAEYEQAKRDLARGAYQRIIMQNDEASLAAAQRKHGAEQ